MVRDARNNHAREAGHGPKLSATGTKREYRRLARRNISYSVTEIPSPKFQRWDYTVMRFNPLAKWHIRRLLKSINKNSFTKKYDEASLELEKIFQILELDGPGDNAPVLFNFYSVAIAAKRKDISLSKKNLNILFHQLDGNVIFQGTFDYAVIYFLHFPELKESITDYFSKLHPAGYEATIKNTKVMEEILETFYLDEATELNTWKFSGSSGISLH